MISFLVQIFFANKQWRYTINNSLDWRSQQMLTQSWFVCISPTKWHVRPSLTIKIYGLALFPKGLCWKTNHNQYIDLWLGSAFKTVYYFLWTSRVRIDYGCMMTDINACMIIFQAVINRCLSNMYAMITQPPRFDKRKHIKNIHLSLICDRVLNGILRVLNDS